MDIYGAQATEHPHTVCQILVSQSDLRSAAQMRGVAQVLLECLAEGIVPIVNGNDVTDPEGSDNDSVAAGIAISIGAEQLLLLTDVDGVYPGRPGETPPYASLAIGQLRRVPMSRTGTGRGGMRSKLRAAELASHNGVQTVIANARMSGVITSCVAGVPVGTRIPAAAAARPVDKRWIGGIARSHGRLTINREAEKSIRAGSSLFASGIKRVHGNFVNGDVVDVCAPDGLLIARGGAAVSSRLMTLVRAMQSREVGLVMAEIVHRFANPGPLDDTNAVGDESARPQLRSALRAVRVNSLSAKRALAVELLHLFPQTAVECMTDASDSDSRSRLASYYDRLSSDLSFIERERLVVF
jgi:glutamate 5-kinase